jgi:hypothetical protein
MFLSVKCKLDEQFRMHLRETKRLLQDPNAVIQLTANVSGLLIRLPLFNAFIETMKSADWQMSTQQLVTFMCDSLAAKLGNTGMGALEAARASLGVQSLSSIMCDGVACRFLRDDAFAASYLHALAHVQTHVIECCAGNEIRAQTCMRRLFRSSPYGVVNTIEEADRLKNAIGYMRTLVDIERLMLNKMPYSKRVQWMRDHIARHKL